MTPPLALLAARPWRRTLFTTYALSLSFVEAVILDALVRGGTRQALVLADVEGVRNALMEQGARRVGRDYELEPVLVEHGGVFHPKLTALVGDDGDAHLVVGSGNLTFNGWGGNLEIFEHLHPSFAAFAFEDAAAFLARLAEANGTRHAASAALVETADALSLAARRGGRDGTIRLVHSLGEPILAQISAFAAELGGGVRLAAAAPYFDDGQTLARLGAAVGVEEVFVHVPEGGSVEGGASNWPRDPGIAVRPVGFDWLSERDAPAVKSTRRLHAKAYEIVCREGRIVVGGSANATRAGLEAEGNVEACVVRLQRDTARSWSWAPALAPELVHAEDADADDTADIGVLRAVLRGDEVIGRILTPRIVGPVAVFRRTSMSLEPIGRSDVAADGHFSLAAHGLEDAAWRGGRLVLRVEAADGRAAEGFVSVAAFADVMKRAGALGSRLLSMLAGTEAPDDVKAIMAWFVEDPSRLAAARPSVICAGGGSDAQARRGAISLSGFAAATAASAGRLPERSAAHDEAEPAWKRFMASLFAALGEARGPFPGLGDAPDDVEDDEQPNGDRRRRTDPAVPKALAAFEKLLDKLLAANATPETVATGLALTPYICDRFRPDAAVARPWLTRLVDRAIALGIPDDVRETAIGFVVTLAAARVAPIDPRDARARLLKLGAGLGGAAVRPVGWSFDVLAAPEVSLDDLWAGIAATRTWAEIAALYVVALRGGERAPQIEELASANPEAWPKLRDALEQPAKAEKIIIVGTPVKACPCGWMSLPSGEQYKLGAVSVALAKNCCGNVIVCTGVT